jgi:hypothetical protein
VVEPEALPAAVVAKEPLEPVAGRESWSVPVPRKSTMVEASRTAPAMATNAKATGRTKNELILTRERLRSADAADLKRNFPNTKHYG